MSTQPVGVQSLSLEGEVVEIFEGAGQRLAKIVLTAPIVLGVTHGGIPDIHLGDRVVVHGLIAIDRVGQWGGSPLLEEDL